MKTQLTTIDGWSIRWRPPSGDGPHPLSLLLHGWTGTEDVMWVFANALPEHFTAVAPRGLYATPGGGFSWTPSIDPDFPAADTFEPAVQALNDLIRILPANVPCTVESLHLIGFSQGAALGYAMAFQEVAGLQSLAGLAGFVPTGLSSQTAKKPLNGLPVFAAHGTKDRIVPVERMRQGVEVLEAAGARVTICEDEVGHKLSANCYRALRAFYKSQAEQTRYNLGNE